jgi:hypothetical protein
VSAAEKAAEQKAILKVVQLYLDGLSAGDATKLRQAFHEQAWMFGSIGGKRFDESLAQMIEGAESHPANTQGNYRGTVRGIVQIADAAIATVEATGAWGAVSFVDFLSLARIDGSWKIVSKTFVHTGGKLPW